MITTIKAKLCRVIDWLDATRDPFEEFTRPANFKDEVPPSLRSLAAEFERDLVANFLIRRSTIVNYRIPLPVGSPLDLGDQALWHGIATAMMAFKYSVTHSLEDGDRLTDWVMGLNDHQPAGRLIRGLDESGNHTEENASNDQATGHLAGIYFAWRYGPPSAVTLARGLIYTWATDVLQHGFALVNPEGEPTTYGALIRGWLTDPLRLSLAIAMMSAAWRMTSDAQFADAYWKLRDQYGELLPYAKMRLGQFDTTYDTHRAALHLAIIRDSYGGKEAFDGLSRLWQMEHKTGNPWVGYLCHMQPGTMSRLSRDQCRKMLREFVPDDYLNMERINSTDETIPKIRWKGEWCSLQPMPRWKVSRQDFFWQRSLYAMDKYGPADSRYSGLDFLAAYWLGRSVGAIQAQE